MDNSIELTTFQQLSSDNDLLRISSSSSLSILPQDYIFCTSVDSSKNTVDKLSSNGVNDNHFRLTFCEFSVKISFQFFV